MAFEYNKIGNLHIHGVLDGDDDRFSKFKSCILDQLLLKSQRSDKEKYALYVFSGHSLSTKKDLDDWIIYCLKEQVITNYPDCYHPYGREDVMYYLADHSC